jgi:PAS domain-containing protein
MSLVDTNRILSAFETITHQTKQVFFVYNLNSGQVEYVNEAFEKVFPLTRQERKA